MVLITLTDSSFFGFSSSTSSTSPFLLHSSPVPACATTPWLTTTQSSLVEENVYWERDRRGKKECRGSEMKEKQHGITLQLMGSENQTKKQKHKKRLFRVLHMLCCICPMLHTFLFSSVMRSTLVGPFGATRTDRTPLPGDCLARQNEDHPFPPILPRTASIPSTTPSS